MLLTIGGGSVLNWPLIRTFASVMQDNYPERLHKAYIFPSTTLFGGPSSFKIASRCSANSTIAFVMPKSEQVAEKMKTMKSPDLIFPLDESLLWLKIGPTIVFHQSSSEFLVYADMTLQSFQVMQIVKRSKYN